MAILTFLLVLLTTLASWKSAEAIPRVSLEKKSDLFIPRANGTFQFDSNLAKTLAYDPESRIIYSTGFLQIQYIQLKRDLTTEFLGGIQPVLDIIFDTIAVCGRFVIVAGGIRDSTDASLLIFERKRMKSKWNDEITFELRRAITVGNGPLSLEVTKDCRRILVASGGEQPDDLLREGYVTMISFPTPYFGPRYKTTIMDFNAFDDMSDELVRGGLIRVNETVPLSADLVPNDIVIDKWEKRAYVTLLKNNAMAVVDLNKKRITDLVPLGYKNHNVTGQGFDPSDMDGGPMINPWPVSGLYQPDGISTIHIGTRTYLITGNKGNNNRMRVRTLPLDPVIFPNAAELQQDDQLGRLLVNTFNADRDGDGDIDVIQATGARSITLWGSAGREMIADSGDQIERMIAQLNLPTFNTDNNDPSSIVITNLDRQSPKKGPEPGSVTSMPICWGRYELVLVANQRPGSIAAFTLNRRNLASGFVFQDLWSDILEESDLAKTWDELYDERKITLIDPRQVIIVKAQDSPSRKPLLMAASTDSGTISVFEINVTNC